MSRPALKDHNILFLDFETGGLQAGRHCPIEVACVLTDPSGKTVLGEYCSKVLPVNPVDPQAAAINGYTQEKWAAEAIPLEHALVRVLGYGRNAMLACHNAPFDKAFLEHALARHKMRWPGSYHSLDTVALAMPLLRAGLVENVKLVTLTKFFGIPHDDAHTALSDARACREVYLRLMEIIGPSIDAFAAARPAVAS